jgi:NAD+ synthase
VRAIVTFLIAEEMNYLVAGCAHKSEDMLGLYVKFGVDDSADVMPLKNLYRTQIIQLAAHLGVPESILNRTICAIPRSPSDGDRDLQGFLC